MTAALHLAPELGVVATCAALGVDRATYYRHRAPIHGPKPRRPSPPRRLDEAERRALLDTLHEPRFVDLAPAEVFATLLDEGRYLGSVRTMYRVLAENVEIRERRNQLRHPAYSKPQLLATAPNQLWSWDITKLLGPAKWTYFYLYVILDVFSRYVVGWMVAHAESATLAEKLIAETCARQGIADGQLTIHADRGSSMKSKPVALLLADLGITKTHSRPHVSDDNPFSEAQFKTLKYRPDFPDRFGDIEDARALARLLPLVQRRAPPRRHRYADARTTCTTAWSNNAWLSARPPSTLHSPRIRSASRMADPLRNIPLAKSGSTSRSKRMARRLPRRRPSDRSPGCSRRDRRSRHRFCSLNSVLDCLKIVDAFRGGDGILHRLTIEAPFCNVEADARKYTATMQAEEDAHGRILAAKQGRPVPMSTETVSQWVDRWLAWRTTRGLSSTPHDKGRLAIYVLPVLGPLPMHACPSARPQVRAELTGGAKPWRVRQSRAARHAAGRRSGSVRIRTRRESRGRTSAR